MCVASSKKAVKEKLPPAFETGVQEPDCSKTTLIWQLELDTQQLAINFKDQAGAAGRMMQLAKQFLSACKFCWFNHSFLQGFL